MQAKICYLIEPGVAYPDNTGRFQAETEEKAIKMVENMYIPLGINENKLYFVFNVDDKLTLFKRSRQ